MLDICHAIDHVSSSNFRTTFLNNIIDSVLKYPNIIAVVEVINNSNNLITNILSATYQTHYIYGPFDGDNTKDTKLDYLYRNSKYIFIVPSILSFGLFHLIGFGVSIVRRMTLSAETNFRYLNLLRNNFVNLSSLSNIDISSTIDLAQFIVDNVERSDIDSTSDHINKKYSLVNSLFDPQFKKEAVCWFNMVKNNLSMQKYLNNFVDITILGEIKQGKSAVSSCLTRFKCGASENIHTLESIERILIYYNENDDSQKIIV
jgi:hypothetical protein